MLVIPDSFLTPSPEEQVIQQRSRIFATPSLALQYDNCLGGSDFVRTPSKDGGLSQLSRKRLLLTPSSSSPAAKKAKRSELARVKRSSLKTTLNAYSTPELVSVIDKLIDVHPHLEQEVRDSLHEPSIQHLEANLAYLRHNVYRALPSTRLETSRDAYAFKRVKVHIQSFKKTCVDQGRLLVVSHSMEAVLKYVLVAWKYVHLLPDWDNPSHNHLKRVCFRVLATHCMVALKCGTFTTSALTDLRVSLQSAVSYSKEIQPCVSYIDKLLLQQSASVTS